MEQLLFLALLGVVGLLRWFSQMAEEKRNREAEKRTAPPPPNAPAPRAPAETEEERIRRFMEALGVPTSNAPIPRAAPKVETPKAAPAAPAAPPTRRAGMPVDPFPVPRGGFPIPPVVVAPPGSPQRPAPAAPPPLVPPRPSVAPAAPPPLPTRETTVLADPPQRRSARQVGGGAEFEVSDISDAYEVAEPLGAGESRRTARDAASPSSIAARLANAQGLRDAIVLREIFGPPRSMQPLDLTRD